jgi:dTDP-4-amino-4,6-dideoxygalactose transaminase
MKTKNSLSDLAIFGGTPVFSEKLHVGRPNIGDRDRLFERFNQILDTRWLSNMGPFEQEFERRVAAMTGVRHCIGMCNATIALEIAIRALGMKGEVIIPSFTFIATAHALQWQEITPVFCEIDPKTHNLDASRIEALITPQTTGIIGVHVWGRPCDTDAIEKVARKHNLTVLYDAAHAFRCRHNGQMIGGFGDAEVFSFHATKFFNTFEGGAVLTNNDDLARQIRLMKNFGFADYDYVSYVGTNGKMSELSAAMGLTSLESLDEFIDVNRRNYQTYRDCLKDIPGISLIVYDEAESPNYQYVVLEIDENLAHINRDELLKILWAENIIGRRYFYPGCHRMEPYRSFPGAVRLPETEKLSERVLTLPTGTAVGPDEVRQVCDVIDFIARHAGDARAGLLRQTKNEAGSAGGNLPIGSTS